VMVLKGWTRIKKSGRARVRSKKQLLVKDSGAARAWKTPRVVETSTTVAPCACKAGWNVPNRTLLYGRLLTRGVRWTGPLDL
jgi:hypothetical protein